MVVETGGREPRRRFRVVAGLTAALVLVMGVVLLRPWVGLVGVNPGVATPAPSPGVTMGQQGWPTLNPEDGQIVNPGQGPVIDPGEGLPPLPTTTATSTTTTTTSKPATSTTTSKPPATTTTSKPPATTTTTKPPTTSSGGTKATIVSKDCVIDVYNGSNGAFITVRVSDPSNSGYTVSVSVNGRGKSWSSSGGAEFTYVNPNQSAVTSCNASIR